MIPPVLFPGFENLDSGCGIYAPDAEAYTVFAAIFDPIIEDYHMGFKQTDRHPPSDWGDMSSLGNVDPTGKYVVSTRVRCGRSVDGYPFNPCLTEAQYKEMEKRISGIDGHNQNTRWLKKQKFKNKNRSQTKQFN